MSIQFWRGGLKREVLKQLARIGMCKGYDTTLAALDKIRQGFDSAAFICKQKIEQLTTAELRTITVDTCCFSCNSSRCRRPGKRTVKCSEGTIPYNPDDTLPYGMESDDGEDIAADPLESSGDETSPPRDDESESIHEDDEEEHLPVKQPGFTMC